MNEIILYQKKDGYRYNSDTLFLYWFIKQFPFSGDILDIGCGCGILGMLLKRDFECSMDLLDMQEQNIKISKKNAKENGLEFNFLHEDFLGLDKSKKYDILVSNPPFYHESVQKSQNEHICKSRYNKFLPLKGFMKKSYELLKDKAYLNFCYDAKQLPLVLEILQETNFNVQNLCFVHPKKNKSASLVLIRARKNAKAMCEIMPPLMASNDKGYTKKAKEIFKTANTLSKDLV